MKKSKVFKSKKIVSGILVLLMAILVFLPLHSEASLCEGAAARCMVDAIIVSFFTGFSAGVLFSLGCAVGYGWCLMYMM